MVSTEQTRTPIYASTRSFLGRRDLVISFYTMNCQFQCTYCALPLRSSVEQISVADLNAQIDGVFAQYADQLTNFRQLSFGNEGSVLDRARFHTASLHHLLDRARAMENLEVLSIETRPEYINRKALPDILRHRTAQILDFTVGFETQDDDIRLRALRKNISRRVMEDRVALLGEFGIRLTSYVLIKPAPRMSEEQGVREAIATMEYLADICARHRVELVIYLTPTYVAEGSYLARTTLPGDWLPPTIQSIYRVVMAGHRLGLPVYTGLWSEGIATADFRGREGYDPELRQAMVRFNQSGDSGHLRPYYHLVDGRADSTVEINTCAPTTSC
jgi:archaeosine synthase beta-subunit